jgi:hypothetical protein
MAARMEQGVSQRLGGANSGMGPGSIMPPGVGGLRVGGPIGPGPGPGIGPGPGPGGPGFGPRPPQMDGIVRMSQQGALRPPPQPVLAGNR